ncbi:MAG TPA: metal-dependent hydrolase [Thermoanaerobacter sp.]|nr:metal-dependent hydrolase [Thermoanaerobacter sp.]
MTEKLFYEDSYITEFDANIIDKRKINNKWELVLDKTYFYPEGGGQPSDTGLIDGIKVYKIYEENDTVYHLADKCPEGIKVHCQVDWERRFDHMQQHTGQHLLSAVLEKKYGAHTQSFSIGDKSSHITITKDIFNEEEAFEVEKEVNSFVYKNIPVKTYFADEEMLKKLPLRKQPQVSENIRIVEIEGIDYSPCGGTHVKTTGEIGIVKIKKWEKTNKGIRLEFVAGFRALYDYHIKNNYVNALCHLLSEQEENILEHVLKLLEENKEVKKEVNILKENILLEESRNLIKSSELHGGIHIVYKLYENRTTEEIKILAKYIVSNDKCIAILGNKRGETGDLVVSRSGDVDIVVNGFFKEVLRVFDGKGGGNAYMCQGGVSPDRLELAMDKALSIVIDEINKR